MLYYHRASLFVNTFEQTVPAGNRENSQYLIQSTKFYPPTTSNIFFASTPMSSAWRPLPFRFFNQNFAHLISSIRATCLAHLLLITFGEAYNCQFIAPANLNIQTETYEGVSKSFRTESWREIYPYNNTHSLRSNTKGYEGKTRWTDSQNSDRELYHLQFSLQAASPETFGYAFVHYELFILWTFFFLNFMSCDKNIIKINDILE